MLKKSLLAICLVTAWPSAAQERSFSLYAPAALVKTGFLKHLLPRFSLKKGIRISLVDDGADATLGPEGTPVFRQGDTVWYLNAPGGPFTDAFKEWLLSDVGKRTIEGFAPDGEAMFSATLEAKVELNTVRLDGDAVEGEQISHKRCGRCHVVSQANRMNAIGSTPSFALMRSFPDWQSRFLAFFTLNPHPAFTQVENVTDPFPENLPSPIKPIEVTLEDIDAIVAFVATIPPADLGAPLQSQ